MSSERVRLQYTCRIFESVHLYIYTSKYMHLEKAARLGSLNSAFHQVCALGAPEWRSVP